MVLRMVTVAYTEHVTLRIGAVLVLRRRQS